VVVRRRRGEFVASFKELEAFLGKPSYTGKKGDPNSDGKVSTQWVLVEKFTGATVTVYDYKETSLYDNAYPPFERFAPRRRMRGTSARIASSRRIVSGHG
jgi:hypothetical protein